MHACLLHEVLQSQVLWQWRDDERQKQEETPNPRSACVSDWACLTCMMTRNSEHVDDNHTPCVINVKIIVTIKYSWGHKMSTECTCCNRWLQTFHLWKWATQGKLTLALWIVNRSFDLSGGRHRGTFKHALWGGHRAIIKMSTYHDLHRGKQTIDLSVVGEKTENSICYRQGEKRLIRLSMTAHRWKKI